MTFEILKNITGYLRIALVVLNVAFCISFIFVVRDWSAATFSVLYFLVSMSTIAAVVSIAFLLFLLFRKIDDNKIIVALVKAVVCFIYDSFSLQLF